MERSDPQCADYVKLCQALHWHVACVEWVYNLKLHERVPPTHNHRKLSLRLFPSYINYKSWKRVSAGLSDTSISGTLLDRFCSPRHSLCKGVIHKYSRNNIWELPQRCCKRKWALQDSARRWACLLSIEGSTSSLAGNLMHGIHHLGLRCKLLLHV